MKKTLLPNSSAFSLTELLAVMAVGSILTALAMPALRGVTAAGISSGVQKTNDLLGQARSEAIVRQLPCRLAIVTDWPSNPKANYRAVSLWRVHQGNATQWDPISEWNYLPEGSVFDPNQPQNPPTYNNEAPLFLFQAANNEFTAEVRGETVTMRFIEFIPDGSARVPGGGGENLWIRIAEGSNSGGTTVARSGAAGTNFADVVADGLIGRIKIYRP